MGCLKIFHIDASRIQNSSIIDTLYGLLRDPDTLVIVNTLNCLNEILAEDGGVVVTKKMVIYLLNRIKEFNEYGQNLIIQTLNKYTP